MGLRASHLFVLSFAFLSLLSQPAIAVPSAVATRRSFHILRSVEKRPERLEFFSARSSLLSSNRFQQAARLSIRRGIVRQSASRGNIDGFLGKWTLEKRLSSSVQCPRRFTFAPQLKQTKIVNGTRITRYRGGMAVDGAQCTSGRFQLVKTRSGLRAIPSPTVQCGTFDMRRAGIVLLAVTDKIKIDGQRAQSDVLVAVDARGKPACLYQKGTATTTTTPTSSSAPLPPGLPPPSSQPLPPRTPMPSSGPLFPASPTPASLADPASGSPEPSPSQTTNSTGDAECFPGEAKVDVEGVGEVAMRDLKIGDRVRVAKGVYSDVVLFTHRDEKHVGNFVEILTERGTTLRMTNGHYLYVNSKLVAARSVKPGDILRDGTNDVASSGFIVRSVRSIVDRGLYNPQTIHGDIVVNGVISSTFTEAVQPSIARTLMKPLVLLYRVGLVSELSAGSLFKHGASFK